MVQMMAVLAEWEGTGSAGDQGCPPGGEGATRGEGGGSSAI